MYESETDEYTRCAACDSEISTKDRVYAFGVEELLCFQCAVERHGVYDEADDSWTVAPNVVDLLERSALDS